MLSIPTQTDLNLEKLNTEVELPVGKFDEMLRRTKAFGYQELTGRKFLPQQQAWHGRPRHGQGETMAPASI